MRNALGSMLEEVDRGVGSSYEATVWQKLVDGTRRAYIGAMYKLLRFSRINGFLLPRESLGGACCKWPGMATMKHLSKSSCRVSDWRKRWRSSPRSWR